MIASLPMYDMAPVNAANDQFWATILHHLGKEPAPLLRDGRVWDHWTDPNLIFSQTCGLPYRAKLHKDVQYVCTPDYGLPDCPAGHYFSYIIARSADLDPNGATPAVNDELSQSGWAALCEWSDTHDIPLALPFMSGAHANSITALQNGDADLAAIDAVTWGMLQKHGADLSGLHIIAKSTPTPSLPYICGKTISATSIRKAVRNGFETLSASTKITLGIRDLVDIPAEDYLAQSLPPQIA